uniref:Choline kinase n=1 Tax=Panagrolaimus sp. ES5 TaxID=591445 RepID=A0AC34GN85_9BILA
MASNFKPKLTFIDFEFATYNPRGFDIADHFAKYACDYSVKNPPYTDLAKLASKEEMIQFMLAYVEEFYPNLHNEEEKMEEAENLLQETMAFLPISPFFWGGYMINHVLNHPSTFDAFGLALERFGIYFSQKHLLEEL